MPMKWYGEKVLRTVRDRVGERLERAGRETRDHIRERLSRSQPTRGVGFRKRGLAPSAPGEYPKKVMGDLRRSINMRMSADRTVCQVGTNVPYGRWLELGTRKMRRRPWLSKGILEMTPRIRAILTRPMT